MGVLDYVIAGFLILVTMFIIVFVLPRVLFNRCKHDWSIRKMHGKIYRFCPKCGDLQGYHQDKEWEYILKLVNEGAEYGIWALIMSDIYRATSDHYHAIYEMDRAGKGVYDALVIDNCSK